MTNLDIKYEPVIGLEVHVQLDTLSKMFCNCSVAPFESEPNTFVCNVCMGYPGTLPVINETAMKMVIKSGLAIGGKINQKTRFDRKNYHYPDLMKGYQISQLNYPIVIGGEVEIPSEPIKKILLNRIHLEEDTAKLTHVTGSNNPSSLIDINRSGTPLMEVVTEPVISNAQEARSYLLELHSIFTEIGVTKGNLEQGHFRCDANISLKVKNSDKLGEKVEVKNMNSFRSVFRAINFEIKRQTDVLTSGERIVQETRGWNESKGTTFSQRSKESAHDYRYFPDPDLPNIYINDNLLNEIKLSLPELRSDRIKYIKTNYDLNDQSVNILCSNLDLYNFFIQINEINESEKFNVPIQDLSNWITEEMIKVIESKEIPYSKINDYINPRYLLRLINMTNDGVVNRNGSREILSSLCESKLSPEKLLESMGLTKISDSQQLDEICEKAIKENQSAVDDYKSGKETAIRFLVGQVMKLSKGKADPIQAESSLLNILNIK